MESMNWVEYKQYMLEQELVWYLDDYVNLWAYIIYVICIIFLIKFIYKSYKDKEKKGFIIKWSVKRLFILFIIFLIFWVINTELYCGCLFSNEIK
jgi:amino acid transporter